MNITDWAPEDRPREKMERYGASRLTNAELLALLISSGSDQENAVDLMKRILADCNNNLNTLGKLTLHDLTTYHGIGPAKASLILAACETLRIYLLDHLIITDGQYYSYREEGRIL